jgi:spore germination protein YaaH
MENADTLKARIDLAKKYQLAGLAMWRLGHEPENFWTTLIQNK